LRREKPDGPPGMHFFSSPSDVPNQATIRISRASKCNAWEAPGSQVLIPRKL
jgi:hypothetical protein